MTLAVETAVRIEPDHVRQGHLSVVVFGPGTGEAVLIKFPDGQLGVIDGCRRGKQSADPVRDLLKALQVKRLLFACLTHPHEDHYGGLVDLVKTFEPAHLLWAGTEHERLLETFAKSFREYQRRGGAIADEVSATELHDLIRAFVTRSQRRGKTKPGCRAQGLSDHKLLLTIPGQPPVEIWSVLPTTTALHRAFGKNSASASTATSDQENCDDGVDPNDISGALVVRWGTTSVLLGGDVLTGSPGHHEGWCVADWIQGPVQVVKVPHHASRGAHCQELWDRMKPCVALVTPFRNAGGPQPPQESMLQELARQVEHLLVTSCPKWWPGQSALTIEEAWDAPTAIVGTPLPNAKPASRDYGAISVSVDDAGQVLRIVAAGSARKMQLRR
ncbi:MAG TPA: MBL fold metallo-hydrolase [Candidatus Paceibacterota bacterium]|nr:MBL fold metallo-hydrolase [Candidatus Paceibacterota bacterium]